jgi:hypothetical protein
MLPFRDVALYIKYEACTQSLRTYCETYGERNDGSLRQTMASCNMSPIPALEYTFCAAFPTGILPKNEVCESKCLETLIVRRN